MDSVLYGPLSEDIDRLLTRRRELGLDRHDEVWDGEYFISPSPNQRHASIQFRVPIVFGPLFDRARLHPMAEFNLGQRDNYRIPDFGAVRVSDDGVWAEEAVIVGEILSPDDKTFQKLDHYAAHGVEEIFVIDPEDGVSVRILIREGGSYVDRDRSAILDISAADIAHGLAH